MSSRNRKEVLARRFVRRLVGARPSVPIVVLEGDDPPKLLGRSYYWTTPGGRPIYYPNAYKWPKVYHPSTKRVEVGIGFLESSAHAARWIRGR